MWFIAFIISSELYMLLSCVVLRYSPKMFETLGWTEKKSFYCKRIFCAINIAGILLACYFFQRHNEHCEAGGMLKPSENCLHFFSSQRNNFSIFFFHSFTVYTLFALMEYVVVLSNMAFHMTAYWDFHDGIILFDWKNGFDMVASNQFYRLM